MDHLTCFYVSFRRLVVPKPPGLTYCQNNCVSSCLKASTPEPGLQVLTVQLARFPISFKPSAVGSNSGSRSIGATPEEVSVSPNLNMRCHNLWSSGGFGVGVLLAGRTGRGRVTKARVRGGGGDGSTGVVRPWPRIMSRNRGGIVSPCLRIEE